jgi:hypothetical protein
MEEGKKRMMMMMRVTKRRMMMMMMMMMMRRRKKGQKVEMKVRETVREREQRSIVAKTCPIDAILRETRQHIGREIRIMRGREIGGGSLRVRVRVLR